MQDCHTTIDMHGDGNLLTARGNPFGNVVKRGSEVIMHSASGTDFKVPVLKQIALDGTWKSQNAAVAMGSVSPVHRSGI